MEIMMLRQCWVGEEVVFDTELVKLICEQMLPTRASKEHGGEGGV